MFGLFRHRKQAAPEVWRTPGGDVLRLSKLIFSEDSHTLIAGATRSGKSTLLHRVMADGLKLSSPAKMQFALIDLKRVELLRYKGLPHCRGYANTEAGAIELLRGVLAEMERRYTVMEGAQTIDTPKYDGPRLYVVIDELIPLMSGPRKSEATDLLLLLLSQGAAARVFVIAGTQAPRRDIIPGKLLLNFAITIGLRCASATDSRVVGIKGLDLLPLHGLSMVKWGPELYEVEIPKTDLRDVAEIISYWQGPECKAA